MLNRGNERITLSDNMFTAINKLAEGNQGAMMALMELSMKGTRIDPDSALGEISSLLSLDSMGIYGTDIYVLFSDICGKQVNKTIAVLRACQLGLFSRETVIDACSRQDYSGREMIPVDELYAKVKERLPNFDPENTSK